MSINCDNLIESIVLCHSFAFSAIIIPVCEIKMTKKIYISTFVLIRVLYFPRFMFVKVTTVFHFSFIPVLRLKKSLFEMVYYYSMSVFVSHSIISLSPHNSQKHINEILYTGKNTRRF